MRDAEAMKMAGARCPGAHAGTGAGLHQVDRRQAAEVMALAVARKVALVRAPAHLTRLRALADEALDRPGVDEFARLLRLGRDLRVALGDVDDLHAEAAGQLAPFGARAGLAGLHLGVGGDVQQRLLHEVRHQPRVGAVREHRGGSARIPGPQRQRLLAQRVIGAAGGGDGRVGVAARPGLEAGVQVHRAFFPAQLDERDARHLDRDVDQEIPASQQRIEHAAKVLACEPLLDELDAVLGGLLVSLVLRGHDGEALGRNADVPQDQRQYTLADAAKTHQQDPSWKLEMNLVIAAHDAASGLPARHGGARL